MKHSSIEIIGIVALGDDYEIGFNGNLLWRIKEDLQRFKRLTMGHPIIMGRKTRDSLPKALPGRTNIVISRNENYSAPDTLVAHSIEEAIEFASKTEGSDKIFIIGGGQIYKEAFPMIDRLEITHIYDNPEEADTYFPNIDSGEWRLIEKTDLLTSSQGPDYGFETYIREVE
ncbi:MAG: dihydrofolate reductase [Muribaculaceae bacterium]|nr:dihydrofolate reductase [Muribaculaceae bacterium]